MFGYVRIGDRMTESELWQHLTKIIGFEWSAQRHEDKYSVDIPDSSFSYSGVSGWIELKSIVRTPRKAFKIPWQKNGESSAGQFNWLKKRSRHGAKCYVAMVVGDVVVLINIIAIPSHESELTLEGWQFIAECWWDRTAPMGVRSKLTYAFLHGR